MPYPLTIFIESSALAQPNFHQGLLNHLIFWRTECPNTPRWIFSDLPISEAIKANTAISKLVDCVLIDEPTARDVLVVLTADESDQSDAANDKTMAVDFFSGQSIYINLACAGIGHKYQQNHGASIDSIRSVDAINKDLVEQETLSTSISIEPSLYEATDALATAQVSDIRRTHKAMFVLAGLGCILTAVAAVASGLPPLLMTLPVIVFWLLKISAKFRKSTRWRNAILARSFAEMLRIRNAAAQAGIGTRDILRMVPRHWRPSMMPAAIALRACITGRPHPDTQKTDLFSAWVTEQYEYYQSAKQREERIAKSTIFTFDAAFTTLTAIATLAVAYSIVYPWLFPYTFKSALVGIGSAIGGCLSSLGLIAINYGRERASGQTVRDYRHMSSEFETMCSCNEANPPELVAEAVAEHASWCGRFLP